MSGKKPSTWIYGLLFISYLYPVTGWKEPISFLIQDQFYFKAYNEQILEKLKILHVLLCMPLRFHKLTEQRKAMFASAWFKAYFKLHGSFMTYVWM